MPGQIGWIDLTSPDATALRDFYQRVVGWTAAPVDMQGYQDFCMHPPGEEQPVAGICHARGGNAGIPPVWLIYLTVENLEESLKHCQELGGEVLRPATPAGPNGRFGIIRDPAGAVCALYETVVAPEAA